MRYYDRRNFYNCFNNTFPFDCGIPVLNLSPMIIDDIPHLNKRYQYAHDTLPPDIYIASKNSLGNFITPCDPKQDIILTFYPPKIYHIMMIHIYAHENPKRATTVVTMKTYYYLKKRFCCPDFFYLQEVLLLLCNCQK